MPRRKIETWISKAQRHNCIYKQNTEIVQQQIPIQKLYDKGEIDETKDGKGKQIKIKDHN